MEDIILPMKLESDDLQVEFELIKLDNNNTNAQLAEIEAGESDIDSMIDKNLERISKLDQEIDRLTNHADATDYWVSIASGVITGIIDILYVGEINIVSNKPQANTIVNRFIEKVADQCGYNGEGRLGGAISYLEHFAPVDQDNIWKQYGISSTRLHHLEDLAHHPTPMGLVGAICVSFLRVSIFSDSNGKLHLLSLGGSKTELLKRWLPILISGILFWLSRIATKKLTNKEFNEQPKWAQLLINFASASPALISLGTVAINWALHLVSDMGGSKNTPGGGMGIPGLILSLIKEMAMVPPFNTPGLNQIVSDLYSKEKVDLRYELAGGLSLGKQAIPVLLNECIISTYFFARQLTKQYNLHNKDWSQVEWRKVLPFNNRTITRMRTISSGVFMVVDLADAAVRAAIKGGGNPAQFVLNMALRVNFVGIGRFVIAIGQDIAMGIKRSRLRNERIKAMSYQINLLSAKMYYKQAKTWVLVEDMNKAVADMEQTATKAIAYCAESIAEIGQNTYKISGYMDDIEKTNPGLLDEISEFLKY